TITPVLRDSCWFVSTSSVPKAHPAPTNPTTPIPSAIDLMGPPFPQVQGRSLISGASGDYNGLSGRTFAYTHYGTPFAGLSRTRPDGRSSECEPSPTAPRLWPRRARHRARRLRRRVRSGRAPRRDLQVAQLPTAGAAGGGARAGEAVEPAQHLVQGGAAG